MAGCGSSAGSPEKKPTFPVTGSVLASGKPLVNAMVTLYPLDAARDAWANGFPRATVQTDGTFAVSTYGDSDGAPAGNYAVLVQQLVPCDPSDEQAQVEADEEQDGGKPLCDKFRGQFTNPKTSAWKITVADKPLEIPKIDIR